MHRDVEIELQPLEARMIITTTNNLNYPDKKNDSNNFIS